MPHLAQESEGRWGVWVINRELDESLHRTGNVVGMIMNITDLLTQAAQVFIFNVARRQRENMKVENVVV